MCGGATHCKLATPKTLETEVRTVQYRCRNIPFVFRACKNCERNSTHVECSRQSYLLEPWVVCMGLDASISPAMLLPPGRAPENAQQLAPRTAKPCSLSSPSAVGVLGRSCLPQREIVCIELDHARCIDGQPSRGRA